MFAADRLLHGDLDQLTLKERWQQISANYSVNENAYIDRLLTLLDEDSDPQVQTRARRWIEAIRAQQDDGWGIEPLLQEFSLNTREGLAMMTLAESLIRVPDGHSADALIEDRLCSADWQSESDKPSPLWLNLSSWALSQARHMYGRESQENELITQMVKRLGEPILRTALQQALSMMAERFVMGETIYQALDRAQDGFTRGDSFSFDMLGEAALCSADAERYLQAYLDAITATARNESYPQDYVPPSISVKLSALHPRFEALQGEEMLVSLQVAMTMLIDHARRLDVAVTIDAEEADRLEPTLDLFERLFRGPADGWGKLGLAVQAYSKRALPVLSWLQWLSQEKECPIPVRLVKGAYWDTEIKLAQQRGQSDYPVFTRKEATDISYLACARYLLSNRCPQLYPQFATHNAVTLSQILSYHQQSGKAFECQRLHGMGRVLYRSFREQFPHPCRTYAPVGNHKDLLPYLVRRLLENGANSSFVSQVVGNQISTKELCQSPQQLWQQDPSPGLPLPGDIYAPRVNSRGINLHIQAQQIPLIEGLKNFQDRQFVAAPIINGEAVMEGRSSCAVSPQNRSNIIGELYSSDSVVAQQALIQVQNSLPAWSAQPVEIRARLLERFADSLESHAAELIYLCIHESGKTLQDSLDELREAVDFCRYYSQQARKSMSRSQELPGITGELNQLLIQPRGLFLCISPWNFPLAIFVGQISAALVCGNGVIAKPARQTGLIAYRCCQLLLECGLPPGVLALLPGASDKFTDVLLDSSEVAGVAFTGSTRTAQYIHRQLAMRENAPIAAMVAETGGQNAMIADSTALPEQLVKDALLSAFGSCGQRCSALRVLYVQEEIADEVTRLLIGSMNQLQVGPPQQLSTDLGPIIDQTALKQLNDHISTMAETGCLLHQLTLPRALNRGNFIGPALIQLDHISQLNKEHFGPILHLIRYPTEQLMRVVDDINQSGYGLTLSIHSRNESQISRIAEHAKVGNVYINRNQIGAVVEAQPFGGQGLSGTGPKAGGANYLSRFVTEKTITTNTTAWGGNAALLSGDD
ncbi:MAG: bifunctional proline dehydrogenase/L-glutamate gamma-semialdehyde dehydrogenase PutA [Motiliproteus sp.]|nr:bifunctional proline dehydrogenase/L-glutamate gamma-semialdehyde dehydrogenase PutA [Motiliproteus sp.]MCW9051623.1 bifunctional proline dehydrogenase/L-glutamate gamma-semialdehyde dehydrogenase PutA [Motiliproteus sp.]